MSWPPMLVVALLLGGPPTQKADLERGNTVDRSCGKLMQVEPVYFNGVPVGGPSEQTPIKNAKLRLYHRGQGSHCCKKQSLAAETITGKDGTFDFTSIEPGSYWLVGRRDGAHYMVAINYDPSAPTGDKCSELSYALRNGELKLVKMKPYVMY
jgi:Prealbumin-like fold domain